MNAQPVPLLGQFHKAPDLFYQEICDVNCAVFGVPAPYHPDMRVNDFTDNETQFADPELLYRQDLWIIGSGVSLHAQQFLQSATGEWVRVIMTKRRAQDGGINGETSILPLQGRYHGWLERLDRQREVLTLDSGTELTRADLRLLHAVLRGVPNKVTAAAQRLSVRQLEARLREIRARLEHPQCDCYSLQGCVNQHRLTRMIMDNADWFDHTPSYRFFPG